MRDLTEIEKAYLAGMVDADGCIGLYLKSKTSGFYASRITITNTDKGLIDFLVESIGGKVYIKNKHIKLWTICYDWVLEGKGRLLFLNQILKYLKVKKRQAEILIEFEKTCCGYPRRKLSEDTLRKRHELYCKFKALQGIVL